MTLREKLKSLKKDKKVSVRLMAEQSNISYHTIVALVRHTGTSVPKITTMIKLAKYFQITLDELVKDVQFDTNEIHPDQLRLEDEILVL